MTRDGTPEPDHDALLRDHEIVQNMEVGLHVYHLEDREDDRSLRFVGANRAAERITGVPREAFLGRTLDENFPALRERGIPQGYARVVRTGEPWHMDQLVYGDHRVLSAAYAFRAFALPGDRVGVVFEDATPRVRAQDELRRSEARQRALLDALPDVLYRVLPTGDLLDVRRGAPGPAGLAREVAARLSRPLDPGEVRMFETRDGEVDLEVRLFYGGDEELLAIVRDIGERKQAERRKDEFVSVVSHELRTPLTSIHGALGLLQGGVLGELPSGLAELVHVARANTERLVRLVNDMLDLDKMEAGAARLHIEPQDAIAVADAALEEMRGAAEIAGVRLRRRVERAGTVLADRDRLLQVLTNLLSNALRFSPPQAVVELGVSGGAGRVRFTVHDEGPGIPPDRVAHLFRKFSQLGDDGRRGGTGLGLAICKAIVDQHAGSIGLLPSERGANFHVDLPEAPPVPRDADLFADLRAAYAAALPGQVEALARALATPTPTARAAAVPLAHRLHGSAGTYGFPEVSTAASELERLLRAAAEPEALAAALHALRAGLPAG